MKYLNEMLTCGLEKMLEAFKKMLPVKLAAWLSIGFFPALFVGFCIGWIHWLAPALGMGTNTMPNIYGAGLALLNLAIPFAITAFLSLAILWLAARKDMKDFDPTDD
ncbi:MAG: hypothetical protein ACOZBH_02470 [Patescibacteria group bacterium]